MSIYDEALSEIKSIRKKHLKMAEICYDAMMQSKTFSENELEIKKIIPLVAKAKVFNDEKQLKILQNQADKLQKKRKEILKSHGITEKEFIPVFTCKKCDDTGYDKNGKMCSCLHQLILSKMEIQSGLPARKLNTFADCNFSSFDELAQKQLQSIYDKMVIFAEKFPNDVKKKNLLFLGPSGSGKTFIINAIASRIIERGYTVLYTTAFSLNNLFAKYHTTFDSSKQLYLDNLINCDLLIIDDLGTEANLKNVTQEYLYSVINERAVTNKALAISTNLSANELMLRYGERTASRILDKNSTFSIPFNTSSLRFAEKNNKKQ